MTHHSKFSILLWYILPVVMLVSCGQGKHKDNELLPGDIVENPASASDPTAKGSLPVMKFDTDEHDFGRLVQGEKVSYGFKFKNTGGSDLIIAGVSSSCGCTVTEYPKNAIKAGEESVIQVTFNSEGKKGFQHKSVTVMANTQPNTKVLKISCEVRVPPEDE